MSRCKLLGHRWENMMNIYKVCRSCGRRVDSLPSKTTIATTEGYKVEYERRAANPNQSYEEK